MKALSKSVNVASAAQNNIPEGGAPGMGQIEEFKVPQAPGAVSEIV